MVTEYCEAGDTSCCSFSALCNEATLPHGVQYVWAAENESRR